MGNNGAGDRQGSTGASNCGGRSRWAVSVSAERAPALADVRVLQVSCSVYSCTLNVYPYAHHLNRWRPLHKGMKPGPQ